MATFIIADDHPLFRQALVMAIQGALAPEQTIETDHFDATYQALQQNPDADLLLLDLHMPGNSGFLGLIQLKRDFPTIPIVVISASDDQDVVRRVMTFGAAGFIPKSSPPAHIAAAISAVLAGDVWLPEALKHLLKQTAPSQDLDLAARISQLTHQQYKVLFYLTEGWLNKQIAYDLHISEATVKAHMTAIFRKLGVTNRTQVVIQAQRLQLEPPSP